MRKPSSLFIPAIVTLCFLFTSGLVLAQPGKTTAGKKLPAKRIDTHERPKFSGTHILLLTDSGNIVLRLYDSTPLHRDNFIAKTREGFYDSLLFHRVIKDFMIQGGDPTSKNAMADEMLGNGSAPGDDKIPAEFVGSYFHKKGALAAARDNNPEKASSNCQFYIVQGKTYTEGALDTVSMKKMITIPQEHRNVYKTVGGTPSLDQNYTVFGEVEFGMNVIDKIASAATGIANRPLTDIRMKLEMLDEAGYNAIWKAEQLKMKANMKNQQKPQQQKRAPVTVKKKTT